MIEEKTRITIVRVLLGLTGKEFAKELGVTNTTVSSWEVGRSSPQRQIQIRLSKLCADKGICFLPSGMPVFAADIMPVMDQYDAHTQEVLRNA